MQYTRAVVLVLPKEYQALKKKLARQKKSLSQFFREKTKEYLEEK